MFFDDRLLSLLHDLARKLNHLPAAGADQVVVVFMPVRMLEPGHAVIEYDLTCESALSDQFHRPVHRSESDSSLSAVYYPVKVFRGDVIFSVQERFEHLAPLKRISQTLRSDVSFEYFLLLRDHTSPIDIENHFQYIRIIGTVKLFFDVSMDYRIFLWKRNLWLTCHNRLGFNRIAI
jgi:hypothetical protein